MSGSIIVALAILKSTTCVSVFKDLALSAHPAALRGAKEGAIERARNIEALGNAACETQNPDEIWRIVSVESGFNFKVLRDNASSKVYLGKEAENMAERIGHKSSANVDIGPFQVNWRSFGRDSGLSPKDFFDPNKAAYFVAENIVGEKLAMCKGKWILCYHSATPSLQKRYQSLMTAATKRLEKAARAAAQKSAESIEAKIAKTEKGPAPAPSKAEADARRAQEPRSTAVEAPLARVRVASTEETRGFLPIVEEPKEATGGQSKSLMDVYFP